MRKNWKTYGVLLVLAAVVLILFYRENISGVGEDKKALEISQLSKISSPDGSKRKCGLGSGTAE